MAPTLMMEGHERTLLDELLGVLRRRKMVILLTTLGMTIAVYLALLTLPEKYEAVSQLQVMLGRENTEVPATAQKGSVYAPGVQREEINSDIQLLKSRELIEQVVDEVGLEPFRFAPPPPQTVFQKARYAVRQLKRWVQDTAADTLIAIGLKKELSEREKVVELLAGSLEVTREGESNVIRAALRLPSRDVARMALAALVDRYLERYAALRTTAAVLPVLETQVEADAADLAALQAERQRVLRDWGISSVERQRAELLARLHKGLYEADSRRSELGAAEARLQVLSGRTAALPVTERDRQTTGTNPSVRAYKERMADLRLKRIDIAGRYGDAPNPLSQMVDAQIATVAGLLAKESAREEGDVTSQPNPLRLTMQHELEQTGVQVAGLRAAIAQDEVHAQALDDELARLNEGEAQLQVVNLRLDANERRFMADAARRDAARTDATLDRNHVVNIVTLAAPAAAPEPVSPQKLRILGFGVLGGLILGLILGMLLEWDDDRIHGREELARVTRLPFLGEFRLGEAPALGADGRLISISEPSSWRTG